jgi:hypothetical protein
MRTVEDRLRAAARAAADTVAPGSAPPLDLEALGRPARGRRLFASPGRGRFPAWGRVLAPAAAAAAVVALVAVSLVLTHGTRPAGTFPLAAPASSPGAAPGPADGLPPYYVSLEPGPLSDGSTSAVVRDTASGATLATVTPPAPYRYFSGITGASDDRTFVLAAQVTGNAGPPTQHASALHYFLLRLDPGGGTAKLTALDVPPVSANDIIDFALSPDGSRLAVASGTDNTEQQITIYDLQTGAARTWQGPTSAGFIGEPVQAGNPLSWTANGQTLAFEDITGVASKQPVYSIDVRLLDTAAPGDDLSSSRVALSITGQEANAMITPDGSMIVIPVVTSTARQVNEYSASTGQLLAVLGTRQFPNAQDGGFPTLLWSDSSGSSVIVHDAAAGNRLLTGNGGMTRLSLAVVTGSQFTPLPGSGSESAW